MMVAPPCADFSASSRREVEVRSDRAQSSFARVSFARGVAIVWTGLAVARRRRASWLLTWLVAWLSISQLAAQAPSDSSPPAETIQVGFSGLLKVGHWNPLRWRVDPSLVSTGAFLEIRAPDSDGVPCWYRWPLLVDHAGWAEGLFYLGRPRSDLQLRIVDATGKVVSEAPWSAAARKTSAANAGDLLIPPTTRVFLQGGHRLSPEQVTPAGSSAAGWRFVHSADLTTLPTSALAYDPIDCIALSLPDGASLQGIDRRQIAALVEWVERGGHLIMSVPDRAGELLRGDGLLAPFAPGEYQGSATITHSDSLEFYAQPANQLLAEAGQALPVCRFDARDWPVDVRQDDIPVVIRRPLGFGRVSLIAFDIQHPLIASWNGRARFLNRVLDWAEPANLAASTSSDLASRFGYSDLSGQLRAATDKFRRVGLVTFTTIALLIGLYLLWIGPGDYFFLRHVVRRMEFTWLTFLLATAGFCGVAWWIVHRNKPAEMQVNQVEVIDIDGAGRAVRGTLWANIYSPRTAEMEVDLPRQTWNGVAVNHRALNSFGLAGRGLGGMLAANQTALFEQPYQCQLTDPSQPLLQQVPIAIAATKPLTGRWMAEHSFRDLGELQYYARANSLSGPVRNPLGTELRKCVLLYGNRAYLLDRIPAGGSVRVEQGTERSLKVFLQAGQGDGESARWNVGDQNLGRIIDMMLFFQAAGGSNFTSLTHDYQSEIDLSPALNLGRAILIGRIEDELQTPLAIQGEVADTQWDQRITMVRMLLPVRQTERNEP